MVKISTCRCVLRRIERNLRLKQLVQICFHWGLTFSLGSKGGEFLGRIVHRKRQILGKAALKFGSWFRPIFGAENEPNLI